MFSQGDMQCGPDSCAPEQPRDWGWASQYVNEWTHHEQEGLDEPQTDSNWQRQTEVTTREWLRRKD